MKDLWPQVCVRTWLYEPPPSSHTHLPCLHILLQISELKRQSNEAVVYFGHKIGSLVPGQNSSRLDPPTRSPFTQVLGLLAPQDMENHHPTQRKGVRGRPTRDPEGAWGSAGCEDIREGTWVTHPASWGCWRWLQVCIQARPLGSDAIFEEFFIFLGQITCFQVFLPCWLGSWACFEFSSKCGLCKQPWHYQGIH